MNTVDRYSGFQNLAHFGIVAEGGAASENLMPVHDALDALSGLSNVARRITLLSNGRPSPSPDDLKNLNVMVAPPSKGSFILEVAVGIAQCGLVFGGAVAANVAANVVTPSVQNVLRDVWDAALGKTPIQPELRIEPWFDSVAEVAEKLHPSLNLIANSVEQSTHAVSLFTGKRSSRVVVATIDAATKLDLSEEITSKEPLQFEGRIRQLNDNTNKGIVIAKLKMQQHKETANENLRFWVPDGNRTGEIVARLARNLAENNAALVGLNEPKILFRARRVTTKTGRTKRILIDEVG